MACADKEKQREYWRKWYYAHKEEAKDFRQKRRNDIRAWLNDLKASLGCSMCEEKDPVCIDFHHRDPSEKEWCVATLLSKRWGPERIKQEIDKCDPLCANCHRKLHKSSPLA